MRPRVCGAVGCVVAHLPSLHRSSIERIPSDPFILLSFFSFPSPQPLGPSSLLLSNQGFASTIKGKTLRSFSLLDDQDPLRLMVVERADT